MNTRDVKGIVRRLPLCDVGEGSSCTVYPKRVAGESGDRDMRRALCARCG